MLMLRKITKQILEYLSIDAILFLIFIALVGLNINSIIYLNVKIFTYLSKLNNPKLAIMVAFEISFGFLIIFSWTLYYFLYRENKKLINDLIKEFKLLPLRKKVVLFNFTIFVAIPNKVYIHNDVSDSLLFFMLSFLFLCIYISPFIVFPLITYFLLILESFIFGSLYEHKPNFKKKVIEQMFHNNEYFAKLYIDFFWGNADSSSWNKGKIAFLSTAFWILGGYLAKSESSTNSKKLKTNTDEIARDNKESYIRSLPPGQAADPAILREIDDNAVKSARDRQTGWFWSLQNYVGTALQNAIDAEEQKKRESELKEIAETDAVLKDASAETNSYNAKYNKNVDNQKIEDQLQNDSSAIRRSSELKKETEEQRDSRRAAEYLSELEKKNAQLLEDYLRNKNDNSGNANNNNNLDNGSE